MRDSNLYLYDILQAIRKIERYTKNAALSDFKKDMLLKDAVFHNLTIIGEAANHLSSSVKVKMPAIEWRKIVDLRNILIHEYFGIDDHIVWSVIIDKLPQLKKEVRSFLK